MWKYFLNESGGRWGVRNLWHSRAVIVNISTFQQTCNNTCINICKQSQIVYKYAIYKRPFKNNFSVLLPRQSAILTGLTRIIVPNYLTLIIISKGFVNKLYLSDISDGIRLFLQITDICKFFFTIVLICKLWFENHEKFIWEQPAVVGAASGVFVPIGWWRLENHSQRHAGLEPDGRNPGILRVNRNYSGELSFQTKKSNSSHCQPGRGQPEQQQQLHSNLIVFSCSQLFVTKCSSSCPSERFNNWAFLLWTRDQNL